MFFNAFEKELVEVLKGIHQEIAGLRKDVRHLEPKTLTYVRINIMPESIVVGAVAQAVLKGLDQNGNPIAIPSSATIVPTAATPADVSFGSPVFNADGSVNIPVTGVNPDPGDAITAAVNGIMSSSDVLTVTAPVQPNVLTSVTLTLQ